MANKSGWWTLEIEDGCIPDDFDLEHIADMIKQGFTEGEIIGEDAND
jgi:protein-tyrosine phosphatase